MDIDQFDKNFKKTTLFLKRKQSQTFYAGRTLTLAVRTVF
jgi:hypothetical protein